jgi:hypothetical protein
MLILAVGFSSVCSLLGYLFYRKYQVHLSTDFNALTQYARIEDYHGRPIRLAFLYLSDEGQEWLTVQADVDEIYHYGRDYFLKGYVGPDPRCRIFKWSRISQFTLRTNGRNLHSLEELIVGMGRNGEYAVAA